MCSHRRGAMTLHNMHCMAGLVILSAMWLHHAGVAAVAPPTRLQLRTHPLQPAVPYSSGHRCSPGLHPDFPSKASQLDLISRLPKAELHIHVEGTLEPELMLEMAARNKVKLPYPNVEAARKARANFTCLQDFLDVYTTAQTALVTRQDLRDLAAAYLAQARANNITHVELFFDAQSHADRGVAFTDIVEGLQAALDEAAVHPDHPITSALILCLLRDKSATAGAATLMKALPFRPGVQTVGLASAELGHPPIKFTAVYAAAKAFGLQAVAHAGEEAGPGYIWQALLLLGVSRVDHGVHAIEDPGLVEYMASRQVPITLCPLSNLHLQVYKGVLQEKLCELVHSGIVVTVNSDDPAFLGGYLNNNYAWLADTTGLGPEQVAQLAKNSFQASFISEEAKQKAMAAVDAALQGWTQHYHGDGHGRPS